MNINKAILSTAIAIQAATPFAVNAEQIGNISIFEGVRDNQLQGYGLVVGLQGTGDHNSFVGQSLITQLSRYGIRVPANVTLNSRNAAVVMVNATLPPFIQSGEKIDVTISSIGNAKSLRGGTLITSPLLGLDGKVYAVAQGQIMVDGVMADGQNGSSVQINTASVGRIPSGATVEREVNNGFESKTTVKLLLNHPSFETSANIAKAINKAFGKGAAVSVDPGYVNVRVPKDKDGKTAYFAMIENLDVKVAKPRATVVINSRSGTVTMTENVQIYPVAISEGKMTINVFESESVSQPRAMSNGSTTKISNSEVKVTQNQQNINIVSPHGAKLSDLVNALKQMGTTHSDLAQILQSLAKAGSLRAKIIII